MPNTKKRKYAAREQVAKLRAQQKRDERRRKLLLFGAIGLAVAVVGGGIGAFAATDPRLQEFVNKFRVSKAYTPEYGGPCTGGLGTPLQT